MSFTTKFDAKEWKTFTKNIKKVLSKAEIDKVLKGTSYYGQREFVKALKSKSINWAVVKLGDGYKVVSLSKVALFLEEGTKAHGPVRAKFLYIPLRPNAAVWRKGMIFGKDYILAKRVKGIKARHYYEPVSARISNELVRNFNLKLDRAVA